MFYILGHFSKFVKPGSVRLTTSIDENQNALRALAFLRPDNVTALVIFNSDSSNITVNVEDDSNTVAQFMVEGDSINTLLYIKN
ncbi:hypothetical protein NQ317_006269 [Molorchus minor]|uniref:Glycosyl hydrolase family 30 beta sandwich domain-containing protein n=1 Tax=Molorchus minor TaxID=1323400 RepID=A0ABQ9IXB7_9CUCU|nr:hypothetical protein NQ317_006269 [Molorchus minor]